MYFDSLNPFESSFSSVAGVVNHRFDESFILLSAQVEPVPGYPASYVTLPLGLGLSVRYDISG